VGAFTAPNCCTLTGKEKPDSVCLTALSKVDVAQWIGPSESAQSALNQTTHLDVEGRCGDRNHNEFRSKNGPTNSMEEEKLWKGSLGNTFFSEKPFVLGELEQAGHNWINETTVHQKKLRNEAIISPSTNTIATTEGRKRLTSCSSSKVEKEGGAPSYQASLPAGETKVRKEDSMLSISRVEDSLCLLPSGANSVSVKMEKNTQSHNQIGLRSGIIKDIYLPFEEQRKTGVEEQSKVGFKQTAEGKNNQTMQVNGIKSFNSVDSKERIVFWVGKSSKNNKWEERKQLRSVLSQISNSISDMAINNCNRLYWLKHGSLETIRL